MSELGIGTAIAEAVLARIRELESKKEELVAAWMAQHGFTKALEET